MSDSEFLTPSVYFNRLLAARDHIHEAILKHSKSVNQSKSINQYNIVTSVVLGSGLGAFADTLADRLVIEYADIPHMPRPSVSGHAGQLIIGRLDYQSTELSNEPVNQSIPNYVLCLSGRVHAYEHQSINQSILTFAVKLCCLLGTRCVMLTNSAGGAIDGIKEGDIVITSDHVRMADYSDEIDQSMTSNSMSINSSISFHSNSLIDLSIECARSIDVPFHTGVYCMSPGPSYETPAEVESLKRMLNIGAYGMSTVPELRAVYQAIQMSQSPDTSSEQSVNPEINQLTNVPVLCMSLCTNLAAGQSVHASVLSHAEVKAVADEAGHRLVHLLQEITHRWTNQSINQSITQSINSSNNFAGLSELSLLREQLMRKYLTNQDVLPLSMPGASFDWKPTKQSIEQTVQLLTEINHNQSPSLCLYDPHESAITDHASVKQSIEQGSIRSIRLTELPMFQSINQQHFSATVHSATITFMTLVSTKQRVCVINQAHVNGFTPNESAYLIDCLIAIGVKCVSTIDHARSVDASTHQSDHSTIIVASDMMDMSWTTIIPSTHSSAMSSTKIFDDTFNQSLITSLQGLKSDQSIDTIQQSAVAYFRTSPSNAELQFARLADCSFVGTINPNLILTARSRGLMVSIILCDGLRRDNLLSIIAQVYGSTSSSTHQLSNPSTDPSPAQIPFSRFYTYDQVVEQAGHIHQWLINQSIDQANRPQCAIVLEYGMIDCLPTESRLPHSTTLQLIQSSQEWHLQLVKIKEQVLYAIVPASCVDPHCVFSGLLALPRVLAMLGVKSLLTLCPVKPISQSNNQSDWCEIVDSINLSGVNPLRGPNDDRFGVRFPDSSNLYDFDSLHQSTDQSLMDRSIAIITSHCLFDSEAENRLHSHIVTNAIKPSNKSATNPPSAVRSVGLIDLVIPANHSGLKVACVGYTSNTQSMSQSSDNTMLTMIERWCEGVCARNVVSV